MGSHWLVLINCGVSCQPPVLGCFPVDFFHDWMGTFHNRVVPTLEAAVENALEIRAIMASVENLTGSPLTAASTFG
jgi:hypothetical protein